MKKPYNATHTLGEGAALPAGTVWATYTNGVQQLSVSAQALVAQRRQQQAQADALAQAQAMERLRLQRTPVHPVHGYHIS